MRFASTRRCWRLRRGCGNPSSRKLATAKRKTRCEIFARRKEFVVNIVTYELAEAMNLTSGEYDASVNEFELAKLTPEPSKIVRPPRVAESPVSFECKLHQILDFSPAPTSGSLVIGEIVSIHINDAHIKDGQAGPEFAGPHRTHGRACSTRGRRRDLRWLGRRLG